MLDDIFFIFVEETRMIFSVIVCHALIEVFLTEFKTQYVIYGNFCHFFLSCGLFYSKKQRAFFGIKHAIVTSHHILHAVSKI